MKRIYAIGLVLLVAVSVYAGKTIFSTHAVKELKTIEETFSGAKKLFITNNWDRVVITLERTYPAYNETNETFKIEGYRREGSTID